MKKLYHSIEEVIKELNIIHNFKYSYTELKETLMAKFDTVLVLITQQQ